MSTALKRPNASEVHTDQHCSHAVRSEAVPPRHPLWSRQLDLRSTTLPWPSTFPDKDILAWLSSHLLCGCLCRVCVSVCVWAVFFISSSMCFFQEWVKRTIQSWCRNGLSWSRRRTPWCDTNRNWWYCELYLKPHWLRSCLMRSLRLQRTPVCLCVQQTGCLFSKRRQLMRCYRDNPWERTHYAERLWQIHLFDSVQFTSRRIHDAITLWMRLRHNQSYVCL